MSMPSLLPLHPDRNYSGDENDPLTPLLALPNELLYLVLAAVSRIEPPLGLYKPISGINRISRKSKRNRVLGVLRLSEVCTRFRALLLTTPDLWARVAFELPVNIARLALSRSGSLQVLAHIRDPSELAECGVDHAHLFALAIEHAAQIGLLTAHKLESEQFRDLFHRQLPRLGRLNVSYESKTLTPEDPIQHVCIDGPELRLVRLEVLGSFTAAATFSLNLKLPTLYMLDLTLPVPHRDAMRVLDCVVDVLQGSPLIRNFKLALAYQEEQVHWGTLFRGHDIKPVNLWSLELEARFTADLVGFCRRVCIHPPARLVLTLKYPINVHEELVPFADELMTLLRRPAHDGLRMEMARGSSHYRWHMLRITTFPTCSGSDSTELAILQIELLNTRGGPVYRQLGNAFAAVLAQTAFKRLELKLSESSVWSAVLRPVAATCTEVTDLVLEPCHDTNCVLFRSADSFPALDTVQVKSFLGFQRGGDLCAWWQPFVAWLERRARAGNRVKRLRFEAREWHKRADAGEYERRMLALEKEMLAQAAAYVEEVLD